MQRIFRLFLLIPLITLVLSGCATIASYDIDEAQIEAQIQDAVDKLNKQGENARSPLSISLKEVDLAIGPDDRDVIVLGAKGSASINAVLAKIPVDIILKVEGTPYYSGKEKAIYIRKLTLIEGDIKSPLFKGESKPVAEALMNVVSKLLETTPVYRLDESDPKQMLLAKLPVDIVVGRGKLRVVPAR